MERSFAMYFMKKMFVSLGVVSCLFAGTYAMEASISTVQAASIIGVVTDENGDAIEDAVIKIKNKREKRLFRQTQMVFMKLRN